MMISYGQIGLSLVSLVGIAVFIAKRRKEVHQVWDDIIVRSRRKEVVEEVDDDIIVKKVVVEEVGDDIIVRKEVEEVEDDIIVRKEVVEEEEGGGDDIIVRKEVCSNYQVEEVGDDIITQVPSQVPDDIISQLPDDILVAIIARLGAKDVRRTSSLSKRWRNLYKFVTVVSLNCHKLLWAYGYNDDHIPDAIFLNRLDWTLRLYSGYRIQSLDLRCCISEANDHFETCMNSLQDLGVETLHLSLAGPCRHVRHRDIRHISFHLGQLHELHSLKNLDLRGCTLVQGTFQLHSLHTLSLQYLKLISGSVECILSSCLKLSELKILYCACPSKIEIGVAGCDLQLKSLTIEFCKGLEEMRLCANNLTFFLYRGYEKIDNMILDHVPQLQTLQFEVKNFKSPIVLKDLPNLKSIKFGSGGYFYQESSRLGLGVEMFYKLRILKLFLFSPLKVYLCSLTPIVHSFPRLEEFYVDLFNLNYEEGSRPEVMSYRHSHLKKVEICGVSGERCEIGFALSILRSATSLKQMHIICFPKFVRKPSSSSSPSPNLERIEMEHNVERIEQELKGQAISQNAHLLIHTTNASYQRDIPSLPYLTIDFHANMLF